MSGPVKLKRGFVPGTYAEIRIWIRDTTSPYVPIIIAPNTTVRLDKYRGMWSCVYRFYRTDILTLVQDGSIVINSANMSKTTKSRIDQFLKPLDFRVYTKNRVHYLEGLGESVPIIKTIQRFQR